MIANAVILTIAILLALSFWLMGELKFLAPYRSILCRDYGSDLLVWGAIVFINVFAALYAFERKFLLKDTGRKLSHMDRQVLSGESPVSAPSVEEEA
jgi:hypothetical protein